MDKVATWIYLTDVTQNTKKGGPFIENRKSAISIVPLLGNALSSSTSPVQDQYRISTGLVQDERMMSADYWNISRIHLLPA